VSETPALHERYREWVAHERRTGWIARTATAVPAVRLAKGVELHLDRVLMTGRAHVSVGRKKPRATVLLPGEWEFCEQVPLHLPDEQVQVGEGTVEVRPGVRL
jgi:hypothetical protein